MSKLEQIAKKGSKQTDGAHPRDENTQAPSRWKSLLFAAGLGIAGFAYASAAQADTPAQQKAKAARLARFFKRAEALEKHPLYTSKWFKDAQEDKLIYGHSGFNRLKERARAKKWVDLGVNVPNDILWFCTRGYNSQTSGIKLAPKKYLPIGDQEAEAQLSQGVSVGRTLWEIVQGKVAGPLQSYFKGLSSTQQRQFFEGIKKTAPLYGLDLAVTGNGIKGFALKCESLVAGHQYAMEGKLTPRMYVKRTSAQNDASSTPALATRKASTPPARRRVTRPQKVFAPRELSCTHEAYERRDDGKCYEIKDCGTDGKQAIPQTDDKYCPVKDPVTPEDSVTPPARKGVTPQTKPTPKPVTCEVEGYYQDENKCFEVQKCSDGTKPEYETLYSKCQTTPPTTTQSTTQPPAQPPVKKVKAPVTCTPTGYKLEGDKCMLVQKCSDGTEELLPDAGRKDYCPVEPLAVVPGTGPRETKAPHGETVPPGAQPPQPKKAEKVKPTMWERFSVEPFYEAVGNHQVGGGRLQVIFGTPALPGQQRPQIFRLDGYMAGGKNIMSVLGQGNTPFVGEHEGRIMQFGLGLKYKDPRFVIHGSVAGIYTSLEDQASEGPTRTGDDVNWEEIGSQRSFKDKSDLTHLTLGLDYKAPLGENKSLTVGGEAMLVVSSGKRSSDETVTLGYGNQDVIQESDIPLIENTQTTTGNSLTQVLNSTGVQEIVAGGKLKFVYEQLTKAGLIEAGGLLVFGVRSGSHKTSSTLDERVEWETTNERTVDGVLQSSTTTPGSRENHDETKDRLKSKEYTGIIALRGGFTGPTVQFKAAVGYDALSHLNDVRPDVPVVGYLMALFNGKQWAAGANAYVNGGILNAQGIAAWTGGAKVPKKLGQMLSARNELATFSMVEGHLAYVMDLHNTQQMHELQKGEHMLYLMGGAEHNFGTDRTRILATLGGAYHRLGGRVSLSIDPETKQYHAMGDFAVRVGGQWWLGVGLGGEELPNGQDAIYGLFRVSMNNK